MRSIAIVFCAIVVLFPFSQVQAAIIHVPGNSATIQGGINGAVNGDTVLVGDGTYTGDGNRDIDFGGKSIVLKSENGPEFSIIDCEGSEADPHQGFHFHRGEDSATVIEGLTITGGYASFGGGIEVDSNSFPTLKNCVLEGNGAMWYGGGIYVDWACGARLDSCSFIGNGASCGGGLHCDGTGSITAKNVTFEWNVAYEGGAVWLDAGSHGSCLSGCIFSNNWAGHEGGAIVYNGSGSSTIENCVFQDNDAGNSGGAIYWRNGGTVVNECLFYRNSASGGGAMFCASGTSPVIQNCTFFGDSAVEGSGIYCEFTSSRPVLEKCIIAFGRGGGAAACRTDLGMPNPTLSCTDIFGNVNGDWVDCIADQAGIDSNFSLNPGFCDTSIADFRLEDSSPCAPTNSSCEELIGAFNVGCSGSFVEVLQEDMTANRYSLEQNFPNPFNPLTTIRFSLPRASDVEFSVINALGQTIERHEFGFLDAGHYSIVWSCATTDGRVLASGVYFYRLKTKDYTQTKKMVLLK